MILKKEDNIIEDTINLFRLKIKKNYIYIYIYIYYTKIKDMKNLFRLKKESEAIIGRIIRDMRNLLEPEEDCYKLVRVGNFWINNYFEYESNGDRKKYY